MGVLACQLATGRLPWSSALFQGQQPKYLNYPPQIPDELSEEVKSILLRSMNRDPSKRPSLRKLIDALKSYEDDLQAMES